MLFWLASQVLSDSFLDEGVQLLRASLQVYVYAIEWRGQIALVLASCVSLVLLEPSLGMVLGIESVEEHGRQSLLQLFIAQKRLKAHSFLQ
jgi:hypothetical protein